MAGSKSTIGNQELIRLLKELHGSIRDKVRQSISTSRAETLSQVIGVGAGDVSYRIDVHAEEIVLDFFSRKNLGFTATVICEGVGTKTVPEGADPQSADLFFLVDPLDGTREIMYDKRSAWVLTGVARAVGKTPTLADIEVAVQTEVPPVKQHLATVVWAERGGGAFEEIWDLDTGQISEQARRLRSSGGQSIANGFVSIVSFFPGAMRELADIAEGVFEKVLGPVHQGGALVFNDQYVSTGGQVYLLASGRYRLVADLRPLVEEAVRSRGG